MTPPATIAVVFDFDDTLAADSTSGYLAEAGLDDVEGFWTRDVAALTSQDWDPVPAYFHCMIAAARAGRIPPITLPSLQAWGHKVRLHDGVDTLFPRLRAVACEANPHMAIEFYLVSSGIGDILRATPIAHEFTDIWASEFHYGDDGSATFPRKMVSFTDKTRYLFQIQKGIVGPAFRDKPFEVNRRTAPEDLRIPLRHMIFVGDGYTDIPCFTLVRQGGGVAIAVFDKANAEKWGRAYQFVHDGRVSNLLSADFSPGSDLSAFLAMAIRKLGADIAVSGGTYQ